jgi:hypothetical protein
MEIGNMSYVFRNMIAKYVSSADYYLVSEGVYETKIKHDVELYETILNGNPVDMKKKAFYGKKADSLLEHMIPVSVTAKALVDLRPSPSKNEVSKILMNAGHVAIILRTENELLPKTKMPDNWKYFDSCFARYEKAGVRLAEGIYVKRGNAIYR